MKLVFGKANAKLKALEVRTGRKLFTFSVLSGHTCPAAKDCQSFAMEVEGKLRIQDGKHTKFRCFSASQEVLYPSVYKARKNNSGLIELAATDKAAAIALVLEQLPKKCQILRIHVAGDMKTLNYFDVWLEVAKARPDVWFYAYTKQLPFWIKRMEQVPFNYILTASYGGKHDALISKHNLRSTVVVDTKEQADQLGLPVDHDDSYAAIPANRFTSFALMLHGVQPAGRSRPKYGYNKETGVTHV